MKVVLDIAVGTQGEIPSILDPYIGGLLSPLVTYCSHLLFVQVAISIGNAKFNEVMEATLLAQGSPKPSSSSDM